MVNRSTISLSVLFAFLYLALSFILMNFSVLSNIFQNNFTPSTTIEILLTYIKDYFLSIPSLSLSLLLIISLLFGINLSLSLLKARTISRQKNVKLTFGIGIVSLAAGGCGACGFSVLSLIGAGGALTLLPFQGLEISLLAIVILSASLYYTIQSLNASCTVSLQNQVS
jgi:hypothetical protein